VSDLDAGCQGAIATRVFKALGAAGINIDMISTSPAHIAVVVSTDLAKKALSAVRQALGLPTNPTD
jgi:aspartate kinase